MALHKIEVSITRLRLLRSGIQTGAFSPERAQQPTTMHAFSMPMRVPSLLNEGYLPVDGGHRLYFAEFGRRDAPLSLVLHGGPGSGCRPSMLDWFDLDRQRVVLLDQRGAGRSLPPGETANNRTPDLVEDMERLRTHLRVARWMLVGGSWGATLALCYAGRYPAAVRAMVLRGVFLGSRSETEWFFQGLRTMVPVAWRKLTAGWTAEQKRCVLQTLTAKLHSVTPQEQQAAARRWGEYEEAVIQAMTGETGGQMSAAGDAGWTGKYRLQSHYLVNNCFLGQRALFRYARHASRIPTVVLHGTHDWICPPENAVRLIRFMPHAELRWIEKGTHMSSDPAIGEALRQAIRDLRECE
jgi:proline iminopeptidase